MNELVLYTRYLRLNYLAGLQYKGWPMLFVTVIISLVTDPIALLLLFARFGPVGGWPAERVMIVYGLALASFGLAELFSRGYDYFPREVRSGTFDRLLLRPRSTFVQVLGMHFHLHRVSKVGAGLLIICWSLATQGIRLGWLEIIMLAQAMVGGALVYTGVFVITSAISFWSIQALSWSFIFTNGTYQVLKCPPTLLPRFMKNLFTFCVPILVFSYYPAAAVGGWGAAPSLGWLALPAGLVFLTLSLLFWRVGVRHYSSTGS